MEKQCYIISKVLIKEKDLFLVLRAQEEVSFSDTYQFREKIKSKKIFIKLYKKKMWWFPMVRSEIESKMRELFSPVSIIFEPVKHRAIKINCYFSIKKHSAYRSSYSESGKMKHRTFECYYCSNFYLKKHLRNSYKTEAEYLKFFTISSFKI